MARLQWLTNLHAVPLTENYRAVLGDCADALTLNPISIKALFRASSALLLMEKYAEAIDCAGRGLTIPGEETNKALKEIVEKATKRKEVKERREGERKERARRETEGRQALSEAFKVRLQNPSHHFTLAIGRGFKRA